MHNQLTICNDVNASVKPAIHDDAVSIHMVDVVSSDLNPMILDPCIFV